MYGVRTGGASGRLISVTGDRWVSVALLAAVVGVLGCDPGEPGDPLPDAALDMTAEPEPPPDAAAPDTALDAEPPEPDAALPCIAAEPDYQRVAIGIWSVDYDADTGAWAVSRPDDSVVVMRSAATCIDGVERPPVRVGRGEPNVSNLFGSFQIELEGRRSAVEWRLVDGPPQIEAEAGRLALSWPSPAGAITLAFTADGDGLRIALEGEGVAGDDAPITAEFTWACGPETGFFGLGTQVVGLDLRGRTFPLWTMEQGIGKPENGLGWPVANIPEAAYAPMGVWHASDGYAAVVTHDGYSELDLCESATDRVALRSHRAAPGMVLMPGLDPRGRMRAISERVGRPPDPPPWVFGPWNDAVGGPARQAEVAERLRAEGIPSSAIWSEDWIGGSQTPTGFRLSYAWWWDEARYPDLPETIEQLHASGFAFLGYFNPFVPTTLPTHDEGAAAGFLVTVDGDSVLFDDPAFRPSGLIDLSNPDAVAWLQGFITTAAAELGIDGWMADFAEWLPVDAELSGGESGWAFHNRYPLAWQQAHLEAMRAVHAEEPRANDFTFFARSGWASINGGSAGLAPAMWAGDQNTDWGRDDGFPTVIPIGVHVGLAGVAMFGSDIAGYTSETVPNTTKELFYRWSAQGALSPLMRTHHGSDECTNWAFDRDDDTIAHYRRYASLHTLLYPYLRGRMDESLSEGLPIMRHPYLAQPSAPGLWQAARDQYFLGDDLLVAPVVEAGAVEREVHLPGRGWWPLLGDEPLRGEAEGPGRTWTLTVPAPVTELPTFVRPGTVLPLLPRVVDSFYGATEPGVSTLEDLGRERLLALYPSADGIIEPIVVDGTTVEGGGWLARPDWSQATLDGEPLPPCPEAVIEQGGESCHHPGGVIIGGVVNGTLLISEGTGLVFSGAEARAWRIAWAGEAFGVWRDPTSVGALDPDIPPPCEAE